MFGHEIQALPKCLRKPIATCDFAEGGGGPDPLSPLDLHTNRYGTCTQNAKNIVFQECNFSEDNGN